MKVDGVGYITGTSLSCSVTRSQGGGVVIHPHPEVISRIVYKATYIIRVGAPRQYIIVVDDITLAPKIRVI